ncbi:MAG: methylated-DNA--[protein]-cysteine S-methyltransferase [Lactobacillus sp.]
MLSKNCYGSPLGAITLVGSDTALTGLWFADQSRPPLTAAELAQIAQGTSAPIKAAWHWLDAYFQGQRPTTDKLVLQPQVTPFRMAVLNLLEQIPYGEVCSYRDLALQLPVPATKRARYGRAVGGAVGHNPIALMIPCHRVIGANGQLTGYAGGLARKAALLTLERIGHLPQLCEMRSQVGL